MNPLIKAKENELAALCRKYRVQRLELFGSAASQAFDPLKSDLDFLVVFERPDESAPGHYADRYFGLLESLEALFSRPVDLVELAAVRNPYFLQSIQSSRSVLWIHGECFTEKDSFCGSRRGGFIIS